MTPSVRPLSSASPVRGCIIALLLCVLAAVCRADQTTAKLVPALGWDNYKQGGFATSVASDAAGNIWVGTEGKGLWKYDPAKKSWTQFTTKDGLGDDCVYALAVDKLNRVWAGHLNHGVSVYNGDRWRNYGFVDGPLGDRVFAIAISPKDGDVWIATDMGLARYSEQRQDWDYYTRASGLPSDQIDSIAFDRDSRIFVGTQCNGIALANPLDNYKKWQTATSAPQLRYKSKGMGLATDMVNAMAFTSFTHTDLILAATPMGISLFASSSGQKDYSWLSVHGRDWKDYRSTPTPADPFQGVIQTFSIIPMPAEDWITAISLSGSNLWLGYRKSGVEFCRLDDKSAKDITANVDPQHPVIIRSILALPNQPPFFAAYDENAGGLLTLDNAPAYNPPATGTAAAVAPPKLPAPDPAPVPADADPFTAYLAKMKQELQPGEAYYLADDWRTEGDWIGRYGTGYTKLCAMSDGDQEPDQDYILHSGYVVTVQIGPHHEGNTSAAVRYQGNKTSDELSSLYDPTIGHRRDAEVNDYSYDTNTYPESYNGPDLWVRVKVPDGVHELSLYFRNYDAHLGDNNKYRDFDVQILPGIGDDSKIQSATPLVRTRVTDFWGGVYKQFMICGPADYVVRIGRNRSYVTKFQGVFLDPIDQESDTMPQLPGFGAAPYPIPDIPDNFNPTPLVQTAIRLWGNLDEALPDRGAIPLQMPFRIWCYRAAVAGQAPPQLLERWRWQMGVWTPEDRKKFDDAMKAAHDAAK